jgi:hypothetical protein
VTPRRRAAPKKAAPGFVRRLPTERGPERLDPDLEALAVPIDDVHPWPGNPRQGDVGALSQALTRFGQRKPLVVQRSTGLIIAGNHTWQAAQALGWRAVAVNAADTDDAEAVAYALADNRTSDLASYDEAQLAELLQAVGEAGLPGTGYDADDVDALLRKLKVEGLGIEAFDTLPTGPKGEFEQMMFTLHRDQAERVRAGLVAAKGRGSFGDTGNENSNGNALARLVDAAVKAWSRA